MEIRRDNMKQILCGFPGIGKSYLLKCGFSCSDSDSSVFSWIETRKGRKRNPSFPKNYINHIKDMRLMYDFVFTSTHKEVRGLLKDAGIMYTMVYPSRELKEDYITRYKNRGSSDDFIKLLNKKWDIFIDDCENDNYGNHIILGKNVYLSDILIDKEEPNEL